MSVRVRAVVSGDYSAALGFLEDGENSCLNRDDETVVICAKTVDIQADLQIDGESITVASRRLAEQNVRRLRPFSCVRACVRACVHACVRAFVRCGRRVQCGLNAHVGEHPPPRRAQRPFLHHFPLPPPTPNRTEPKPLMLVFVYVCVCVCVCARARAV